SESKNLQLSDEPSYSPPEIRLVANQKVTAPKPKYYYKLRSPTGHLTNSSTSVTFHQDYENTPLSDWMLREPGQHLIRALVRGKARANDLLNPALPNNQGQPFQETLTLHLECWQTERIAERKCAVAKDLEGKMQAVCHLLLVLGRLRAQPENLGSQLPQLFVQIAKSAGFWRATPPPRDGSPTCRERGRARAL